MASATHPQRRSTHRTVADVMSQDVVTVGPGATYREVARLLLEHRVSALPVVDEGGMLAGVVSEEDLLAKERHVEEPFLGALRPSWRAERSQAQATLVRDLMTSPAITVPFRASIATAARAMARQKVHRLCVVNDAGALIGVVTRGDLLRPFARHDAELTEDIRTGVILEVMALDPRTFAVRVEDGVAYVQGVVERRSDVAILDHLLRTVDGIVDVKLDVTWTMDDSHIRVRQFPPVI